MSHLLINRSPDLNRLRDEGYDIEIRSGHLLVKNIPYVNAQKEIKFGTLVSELSLSGDVTVVPGTHVVYFMGEQPCHKDGSEINQLKHNIQDQTLAANLVVNRSFSNKPSEGYKDYFDKMSTYITIISSPACSIDPKVTAKTFPVIEPLEDESIFKFIDTASSRAGINAVTAKLQLGKIGIVGLGGTGSYVLDLLAKTPVKEIHLFDGDIFSQHNAFRSPSTPSIDELRDKPLKVKYFGELYSKMHRGIICHNYYLTEENINELKEMDFIFLCIDTNKSKKFIIERLDEWDKSYIDVGMGIQLVNNSLLGILRVTTNTTEKRCNNRIPLSDVGDDEYSRNIQIADLNALNAAMAVIKWKKLCGFYLDFEKEHNSTYTIDGNMLLNEDKQ